MANTFRLINDSSDFLKLITNTVYFQKIIPKNNCFNEKIKEIFIDSCNRLKTKDLFQLFLRRQYLEIYLFKEYEKKLQENKI